MVYLMIILFMVVAKASLIAVTKGGKKFCIGFKASLFSAKLTICKQMRKFC